MNRHQFGRSQRRRLSTIRASLAVPVCGTLFDRPMKKLRLQSLKLRLILQMLVILLPVTLLLGYQSWMDLHRAEVVERAFQLASKTKETHDRFRGFVQGAADAVDSGRVARTALTQLDQ